MISRARQLAPRAHLPLRQLALCLDCDECFEIGSPTWLEMLIEIRAIAFDDNELPNHLRWVVGPVSPPFHGGRDDAPTRVRRERDRSSAPRSPSHSATGTFRTL